MNISNICIGTYIKSILKNEIYRVVGMGCIVDNETFETKQGFELAKEFNCNGKKVTSNSIDLSNELMTEMIEEGRAKILGLTILKEDKN